MGLVGNWLIWGASGGLAALGMEVWSRFLHRRMWHGPFWRLHRSHHAPKGRWEANDLLPLSHAPVAAGLILYGCLGAEGVGREVCFGVGMGMTVFGMAYVAVHDGVIHRRLPTGPLGRLPGMARIREAHLAHHRRAGPPFGMFFGPSELARARARGEVKERVAR
jgi:beta-carotene 3-hydroxylase